MTRIDPQGGWFNLGDRDLRELDDTARVTRPASAESAGMERRAERTQTLRIAMSALVWSPEASYARNDGYIANISPNSATGRFDLTSRFPPGTQIQRLNSLINVTASGTGLFPITIGFISWQKLDPTTITFSGGLSIDSTTAGWVESAADGTTLGTNFVTVKSDYYLVLEVTFAPTTTGHQNISWVELTYLLPA